MVDRVVGIFRPVMALGEVRYRASTNSFRLDGVRPERGWVEGLPGERRRTGARTMRAGRAWGFQAAGRRRHLAPFAVLVPVGSLALSACFGILGGGDVNLQIEGRVTSSADGRPLPGIVVELTSSTSFFEGTSLGRVSTDAEGRYRISRTVAECGVLTLQAAALPTDGYQFATSLLPRGGFDAEPRCEDGLQTIDVELDPDP